MANQNPPWAAYWKFMSVYLIALGKKPGVSTVGIMETWCRLFSNCVLMVTGPKVNHAYKDDQICTGLQTGINGMVHRVQYIWDASSTKENWSLLLIDTKNSFNEINQIIMLWTVHHLWPSGDCFVFNFYHHHSLLVLQYGYRTGNILHSM